MPIVLGGSGLSWSDARTKVRGDLWRAGTGGVPDDVVDRALHASIQQIEGERRWLWLENIIGTLTVDTQADHVDIPASVQSITSISFRSSNSYDVLAMTSLPRVREASQGTTGWPAFYALTQGRIYFDTNVSAGTEFELIFTARCAEQLQDAIDVDSVTLQKQQQAVLALACHFVALSYLKNNDEAGRQFAAFERHLDRMMDIEDQARGDISGGCIVGDTAYEAAAYGRAPLRI